MKPARRIWLLVLLVLVVALVAATAVAATAVAGRRSNPRADSSTAEQIRAIERSRLRALVEADMTIARPLHADDFQLINPAGDVLSREDLLGGVAAGDIDFLVLEPTSPIQVRLSGQAAIIRYRSNIDIVVAGLGRLIHQAWHTDLYERRQGRWQIVWGQTTSIGPLPTPSEPPGGRSG